MFNWLAYSSGFLGLFLINNTVVVMLIYRYDPGLNNPENLPLLIPSFFVGMEMFLCRSLGALTQPIFGYYSDRYWSRLGKRRPFMAAALLPMIAGFILLFVPPLNQPAVLTFIYLIIILAVFYFAIACYQISYLAWLPTLATTNEAQVNLSTLMAIASVIGAAISGIASPWLTQHYGFTLMSIIISSVSFITLALPLAIQENFVPLPQEQIPFYKSLQFARQNQAFISYLAGVTFAWVSVSIVSVIPAFIAIALLQQNVSFGSVINAVALLGIICGFSLVAPLVKLKGKKATFQLSMVWLACGLLILSIYSIAFKQTLPWLSLLFITYIGLASFFVLPNAMLPDVIARDRSLLKDKSKAIYFGMRGLLIELGMGLGFCIASVLLMLGKTAAQPWGVTATLLTAIIFALLSARSFSFYPKDIR